ncbi:MAG: DUF1801 domain-containing protein [Anaerolineales bacterium]
MNELKTKATGADVQGFLKMVEPEERRKDCLKILKIMKEETGEKPRMWGDSIVGFGSYHYKGKSGREGDWFLTGFAPRKQALTLYIMAGFDGYGELMRGLGKYTTGKGCLYVKKLSDVNEAKLRKLIKRSAKYMAEQSGATNK